MAQVDLTIDQLTLDGENPRIDAAAGHREALQKLIDDEPEKFVRLAKDIAKRGLNPMDRLLVYRPQGSRTYTVVEGNRRAAALKVLANPVQLGDLNINKNIRSRLEEAAKNFSPDKVEPVACFDVGSRGSASGWVKVRHTGENNGIGVVPWKAIAQSRYVGGEPALEVLDFVRTHGDLSDTEMDKVSGRSMRLTTLRRLMDSRPVRKKIGIDVVDGVIHTGLPAEELIKPLRRMVLDIANGDVTSRKLHTVQEQADYIDGFPRSCKPKKSLAGPTRSITEIMGSRRPSKPSKTSKSTRKSASERSSLIPRGAGLNVSDPKIGAIATELQKLKLEAYPHAVAVLLRVFLELSTDHYMKANGIQLTDPRRNGAEKTLRKKVRDVVEDLIRAGASKKDFQGIQRALDKPQSPLYIELLHGYVHNQFVIPKTHDLLASWDEARPYFERIWA